MRLAALVLLALGVASGLDGKSIVDPVLKHDAKQCGQYLCPGFPNAAEKYILDGCEGDFKDTIGTMDMSAKEDSSTSSSAVSTTLLLTLSGSCGVAALLIGFVAGAREERQLGSR